MIYFVMEGTYLNVLMTNSQISKCVQFLCYHHEADVNCCHSYG